MNDKLKGQFVSCPLKIELVLAWYTLTKVVKHVWGLTRPLSGSAAGDIDSWETFGEV